ncbi:MAG: CvpA family protein [Thermoflavifilum sp.]|nr:CvpA family protein [Thermoflavifilum sp.]MCL6512816.1 CvpA family protein [Alicyclobacillus sp.]
MDLLDLIMVAIVVLAAVNGYRTGFIRQLVRLFGTAMAYGVAWWLRPVVAPWLMQAHLVPALPPPVRLLLGDAAGAMSFVLVFAVCFALLRYAAGLIETLFSLPLLSTVNRLAGMAAGIAIAIVVLYVGVLAGHLVPNDRVQRQLAHSAIARWLVQAPVPGRQSPVPTGGANGNAL